MVVLSHPDHSFKTGLGAQQGSHEKHENYLVDYNQIISAFSIDDFEELLNARERENRVKKLVIVELIFGINGKFMRPSAWDRHQRGGEHRRAQAVRSPASYAAGASCDASHHSRTRVPMRVSHGEGSPSGTSMWNQTRPARRRDWIHVPSG